MGWKFIPAQESFHEFRGHWDRINGTAFNHILLDSAFVAPLLENFGNERILLGVYEEKNVIAGLTLLSSEKFGFWQTFQPAQAPIGLVVVHPKVKSHDWLTELIHELPGIGLGFSCTQLDPDFLPFQLPEKPYLAERLDYIQTARIRLAGNFEDYWGLRPKVIVKNLDKRKRRLDREGAECRIVSETEPGKIKQAVKDFGDLEQTGWKGKGGTAVGIHNAQGSFYVAILENFCANGEGGVYKWLINDEVVACNLCVQRNGTLIILKTAYAEDKKAYSPGLFMHKEMLQLLFSESNIHTVEFYGKVLDWHRNFSDEFRQMYHLTSYRNPMVRMVRAALRTISGRG